MRKCASSNFENGIDVHSKLLLLGFHMYLICLRIFTAALSMACCRKLRCWFHLGDRAIIYIFIAASYTPWYVITEKKTGIYFGRLSY